MKYPEECPVFRLTGEGENVSMWREGDVVVAVGFDPGPLGSNWLACICDGYAYTQSFTVGDVMPLTRAAREMLALVKS